MDSVMAFLPAANRTYHASGAVTPHWSSGKPPSLRTGLPNMRVSGVMKSVTTQRTVGGYIGHEVAPPSLVELQSYLEGLHSTSLVGMSLS